MRAASEIWLGALPTATRASLGIALRASRAARRLRPGRASASPVLKAWSSAGRSRSASAGARDARVRCGSRCWRSARATARATSSPPPSSTRRSSASRHDLGEPLVEPRLLARGSQAPRAAAPRDSRSTCWSRVPSAVPNICSYDTTMTPTKVCRECADMRGLSPTTPDEEDASHQPDLSLLPPRKRRHQRAATNARTRLRATTYVPRGNRGNPSSASQSARCSSQMCCTMRRPVTPSSVPAVIESVGRSGVRQNRLDPQRAAEPALAPAWRSAGPGTSAARPRGRKPRRRRAPRPYRRRSCRGSGGTRRSGRRSRRAALRAPRSARRRTGSPRSQSAQTCAEA